MSPSLEDELYDTSGVERLAGALLEVIHVEADPELRQAAAATMFWYDGGIYF